MNLRILACLAIAASSYGATVGAADDDRLIRLRAAWDRQRTELVSGKFELRHFFRPAMALRVHDRDEIMKLVGGPEWPSDKKRQDEFFQAIAQRGEGWPTEWWEIDLAISGDKTRQTWHTSDDTAKPSLEVAYDGETGIHKSPNQVTLNAGRTPIATIDFSELRFTPPLLDNAVVKSASNGVLEIEQEEKGWIGKLVVDETTGLLKEFAMFDADGKLASVWYQLYPVVHPGDIVLPSARFRFVYVGEKLDYLEGTIIKKAILNEESGDEEFLVGATQGTTVVDKRESTTDPTVSKVGVETADARVLTSQRRSPPPRSYKLPLFAALGTIAFVALLYWFRRVMVYRAAKST